MSGAIRTVVVCGGGVVALSAAVGLARALPRARVLLLPVPVPADALADRLPVALPANSALLAKVGIPVGRLSAQDIGAPRLASRFADWGADVPWLVGEGEALAPPGIALQQLWLRAAEAGSVPPFHDLVPACALATAGAALPQALHPASPLVGTATALHFDAARLTGALAGSAGEAGVQVAPRGLAIVGIERGPAGIVALGMNDGCRWQADLFVDASGSARALRGSAPAPVADWRPMLPVDRLLLAAPKPYHAIDTYRARPGGWQADWPAATGYGFSATSDEAAARKDLGAAGARCELVSLDPGRLIDGWSDNVLSLGEAAVQPGPLGLLGYPIALGQLALALELLPGREMAPLLLAEYNRRAGLHADRLRDTAIALYVAGTRPRGAFWARAARAVPPEPLAARMAQFARRGTLSQLAEDSVDRDVWAAILLGRGVRPQLTGPVALNMPADAARTAVWQMAHDLARTVAALPTDNGNRT